MLNHAAGIDIVHVAYRGTPPSVTDLINGQIPLVWAVPLNVMPLVAQGKAKLLALSAPRRLDAFPGIAVAAESVPGFDVTLWVGVAAPAGTPPEIVARLAQAIARSHRARRRAGAPVDARLHSRFSQRRQVSRADARRSEEIRRRHPRRRHPAEIAASQMPAKIVLEEHFALPETLADSAHLCRRWRLAAARAALDRYRWRTSRRDGQAFHRRVGALAQCAGGTRHLRSGARDRARAQSQ